VTTAVTSPLASNRGVKARPSSMSAGLFVMEKSTNSHVIMNCRAKPGNHFLQG
jgi:hypothetical protein